MKALQIVCSLIVFFLASPTTLLFAAPGNKTATQTLSERLVNITLQEATLDQTLDALAQEMNVNVRFVGQKPTFTRDVTLKEVTLAKALNQIMRSYGLHNQAVAYQAETNTLLMFSLKSPPTIITESIDPVQILSIDELAMLDPDWLERIDELSPNELLQLAASDEDVPNQPLSHEEMQGLSADPASKPLSDDEMANLDADDSPAGASASTALRVEELMALDKDGPGQ